MAFINEIVPPEDLARIDWSVYHVSVVRRRLFEPYMWTIDRDRNVFLVEISKRYPGPQDDPIAFGYNWRGTLIIFWARRASKREEGQAKDDYYWDFELKIPEVLKDDAEEIKSDLIEAIEAHGSHYCGPAIFRGIHIAIR